MTRDRKLLYILSIALTVILLGSLFLPGKIMRMISALIIFAFGLIVFFCIKKRPILSINKNTVLLIMIAMSAVCLVLYYLTGIHFGFYKSSTPLSARSFFTNILPISTIIIAIEFIRYVLLAQNAKFIGVLVYILGVISELLVSTPLGSVTTFNRFMDVVGLFLLPAFIANVLYNFLAKNYGFLPCIAYRLTMTLYLYILPIYPQTPDAFFSFAKLLVPLGIYVFLRMLYFTKKHYEKPRSRAAGIVSLVLSALFMISIVLLISCEFRYRALVVATESMTGEINKGDVIIYEEYGDQHAHEQDVVVFVKNDARIVHRVVYIENINGKTYYYTKGDANKEMDTGYITDADIEGIVLFKISYVGQPSLWLRDLFKR